ncbi:MAG: acyl-CoA dehydratase activase, partial [Eubacteriales bacterium]|nr:acyl-CoA dehydratase activase [Eubacteriales bacterium]
MRETEKNNSPLLIGIDVGSTTTKVAAVAKKWHKLLFSDYARHHAAQLESIKRALKLVKDKFPKTDIHLALTGSGAKILSEKLGVPYIQEVVANSIALKSLYSHVGTAIELGGQDAKMIFFNRSERKNSLSVADMRMNGSCAGGTGAFIDEVASLLKVPVEKFDELAAKGSCVYDISGRCGVYAKTDIQPLLNQGVSKADLALSSFHAIAKQTIGGLAQGLKIEKPVAFEGGPLTFHKTLVRVFSEMLELRPDEILQPEQPEIMIAYGAALSLETMFSPEASLTTPEKMLERIEELSKEKLSAGADGGRPLFADEEERRQFVMAHPRKEYVRKEALPGETVRAYLGIDSGSTTTKFVLIGEDEELLDTFYASNEGEPLEIAKKALIALRDRYRADGARLEILGAGTTGYGEMLFSKAFSTECHVVETVAHARAAGKYVPDATFLLDIGGQDMKAIWIDNGIITNIVVNEACSSGCGSFLENFASSLHIPTGEIAERAFSSRNPAVLGSRCTVFMTSSIVTEQRNGKLPEDIMAGLCRSIIENVFTKVIRISNLDSLGNCIVVQGGTFENDAVLRALEQYVGKTVTRAPYPGVMGAIGAALLAKEYVLEKEAAGVPASAYRTFIGLDAL